MTPLTHYFVTDIETDGPYPDKHSMLSFGTVVVTSDGELVGEFECNLEPLEGRQQNESTMVWWKTQPEAWLAATSNPEPAKSAIVRFADWVEGFSAPRVFTARPIMFDGMWIDSYLRQFANSHIFSGPTPEREIFSSAGLDIMSYAHGIFSRSDFANSSGVKIPDEWLGNHKHTHRAIDDARGYAVLLSKLFKLASNAPKNSNDFLGRPVS